MPCRASVAPTTVLLEEECTACSGLTFPGTWTVAKSYIQSHIQSQVSCGRLRGSHGSRSSQARRVQDQHGGRSGWPWRADIRVGAGRAREEGGDRKGPGGRFFTFLADIVSASRSSYLAYPPTLVDRPRKRVGARRRSEPPAGRDGVCLGVARELPVDDVGALCTKQTCQCMPATTNDEPQSIHTAKQPLP